MKAFILSFFQRYMDKAERDRTLNPGQLLPKTVLGVIAWLSYKYQHQPIARSTAHSQHW